MPAKKETQEEPIEKDFYKPCATNPKGVTRSICQSLSSRWSYNSENCCVFQGGCQSPWRVCKFCLRHGSTSGPVVDPIKGVCEFHLTHPENEPRPLTNGLARRVGAERAREMETRLGLSQRSTSRQAKPLEQIDFSSLPKSDAVLPAVIEQMNRPTHGNSAQANPGYVNLFDPEKNAIVQKTPMEVLRLLNRLRNVDKLTYPEISERWQMAPSYLGKLRYISKMDPQALKLLASMTPAEGVIMGVDRLFLLSKLRKDLQELVMRDSLAGITSLKALREMVKSPENLSPKGQKKSRIKYGTYGSYARG